MSRALEIVIEALVLEGFDPASRDAIGESTIAALSDLLRGRDLHLQAADTPRLVAQPIQLSSLNSPRAVGEGIARAVSATLPDSRATGAGR